MNELHMPDGGSDCCGTCWFNARNKGEQGYAHLKSTEPSFCIIRNLPIEDPFWTYCANHPYRRPDRDSIPIGPIYIVDDGYHRKVWQCSPDTLEIRQHLLDLAAKITDDPKDEYPAGLPVDETVILQLGEFREQKAESDFRRIATFSTHLKSQKLGTTRERLVLLAKEALQKLNDIESK